MSRLSLRLLGPPRIERDGATVSVDTRKAIALAANLAMSRGWETRDSLAALLWPDYGQSSARAALRRTLSTLNKALGGEGLLIQGEAVELHRSESLTVDVDEFRERLKRVAEHGHVQHAPCRACLQILTEAVGFYRQDFLAGFSLRDSPEFDDWQYFQAESLRREFAQALEQLVVGHASEGELEVAIEYARRWLELDRLHEPAHRHLIQLYHYAGQRSAALRQYEECVRVLEDELGTAPSRETRDLYLVVKEGKPAGSIHLGEGSTRYPSRARQPFQPPRTDQPAYPFVGRSDELAALLERHASIQGDGHAVVIEGEAGIGKSRLAEELMRHVQAEGAAVLTSRCYEGETEVAYVPFSDLLEQAVARLGQAGKWVDLPGYVAGDVARLAPSIHTVYPGPVELPAGDGVGAQGRLLESVRKVLMAAVSGLSPGLLFLDDLHWMDHASLDLIAYLTRRLRDWPVYLVVTWRDELLPTGHRLRRLLAEAQRMRNVTVLQLTRLDRPAVLQLVSHAVPPEVSREIGDRLYQETEGLPLFVNEYLNALSRDPAGAHASGWSLPGGVRDVLYARLVDTSEVARHILSTAAVLGRSFDFDTVREASGRDEELVVTAFEELAARGLVEEEAGGVNSETVQYDFTHDKLRTLVYEETALARRRILHRRVAETLARQARADRDPDALAGSIAHHFRLAGQDEAAAQYFELAGEHHRRLYAHREALSNFESALLLGYPQPGRLHESVGDVQTLLGDYGSAIRSYEDALAFEEADREAAIEHKLGNVYGRRGEWDRAHAHYQAAESALPATSSPAEEARLYADWSLNAYHQGTGDRALSLAEHALEVATRTNDARTRAQAHNISGILAKARGDRHTAQQHLMRSLELATAMNDPAAQAAALNNLALLHAQDGEYESAIERAEAALKLAVSQGDRHREAALHNNLADLHHAKGQPDLAIACLKQAVAIYAEIGIEAGAIQPEIWKLAEW